jgi:hypothetical protein
LYGYLVFPGSRVSAWQDAAAGPGTWQEGGEIRKVVFGLKEYFYIAEASNSLVLRRPSRSQRQVPGMILTIC